MTNHKKMVPVLLPAIIKYHQRIESKLNEIKKINKFIYRKPLSQCVIHLSSNLISLTTSTISLHISYIISY